MQGFFFVIVILVVIAVVICGWYAAQKRRKELAAWALNRHLYFCPDKIYGLDDQYPAFNCLQQGHDRYAYNAISDNMIGDRKLLGFDYHYTTGSGKNRQDHNFSAIILQSPIVLKPLLIRPENFLDKVAEFAGFNDIDFESAEFSRKFYVRSPDKKWAYDVIHPRMMEFLLASPLFTIQFDLTRVMACRSTTFSASDYEAAIDVLDGIFAKFPEYLVNQQKGV